MASNTLIRELHTRTQLPIRNVLETCKSLEDESTVMQYDELSEDVHRICNACEYILRVINDFYATLGIHNPFNDATIEQQDLALELIAGLIHELMTPTNIIIGLSQVILEENSLTQNQQTLVNQIRVQAQSVAMALREILEASVQSR